MKRPEKKNEWITCKKKPTIEELEKMLNDRGCEIMPNGGIRVKNEEAIGYNKACGIWEEYHNNAVGHLISEDIDDNINVIKEIIIWAIYEEMNPINIYPPPKECDRKQEAIETYLGQRVDARVSKLPLLYHKVNKIMCLIRQAIFEKFEKNDEE